MYPYYTNWMKIIKEKRYLLNKPCEIIWQDKLVKQQCLCTGRRWRRIKSEMEKKIFNMKIIRKCTVHV